MQDAHVHGMKGALCICAGAHLHNENKSSRIADSCRMRFWCIVNAKYGKSGKQTRGIIWLRNIGTH